MFCADFEAHISAGQILYLISVYFNSLKPIAVLESVHNMRQKYADKASRYQLLKKAYYCRKIKFIQLNLPL